MSKLQIKREVLEKTRERSNLAPEEKIKVEELLAQQGGKGAVSTELTQLPVPFLRALMDDSRLTPHQRAQLARHLFGMNRDKIDREEIYQTAVSSPIDFGSTFVLLGGKAPNCELFLNGRWYPVIMSVQFLQDQDHVSRVVLLQSTLSICEVTYTTTFAVYPDHFLDDTGHKCERTVLDLIHQFGLRRLQTEPAAFNLKMVRAEREARETGKVVQIAGPVVLAPDRGWWARLDSRSLGTAEHPRRAIIEPDLEVSEEKRAYYCHYGQNQETLSRLPFVRVFSFDTKAYVYADVDDVHPYEFDTGAMDRLHLPHNMVDVLRKVFNTSVDGLFGDLIQGKHGGMVILACGHPGVGKTLTAEVYAETTRRPLYVLELGEMGTTAEQLEERLQRIFDRVTRWNAVLQFDECEIFLATRGNDLERSAIVGIFLRLLDYYRGILFLTTNRADALDYAVRSRVMLRLDYPDLDEATRAAVWRDMLASAGLRLTTGTVEELATAPVNGRQIRNLTRLARILHPEGEVTLAQMQAVLRYGSA